MTRAAFIASVFDQNDQLAGVLFEADGIHSIMNGLKDWKCFPIFKASIEDIRASFSRTDDFRYQIFHFAGHAFDKYLQFNDTIGSIEALEHAAKTTNYLVDPGGLAGLIMAAHQVQLVFLNGCATKNQVDKFRAAGVPAVIFTNHPVKDRIGLEFAKNFYKNFFQSGATLQQSFQIALAVIDAIKNNLTDGWIDETLKAEMFRGGLNLAVADNTPLYELSATDEIKGMKLADWPLPFSEPGQLTTAAKKLHPIPESLALLCDRNEQADQFSKSLGDLVSELTDDLPQFFFIHDLDAACPLKLPARFKDFDLPYFLTDKELKPDAFEWHTITELPEKDLWQQKAPCLTRLKEIYEKILLPESGAAMPLISGQQLIVHHDLSAEIFEWEEELEALFSLYLDDFRTILASEFGLVKMVLFSVEYYDEESRNNFGQFVTAMEQLHPGKLFNFTGLSPVGRGHIGHWRRKVFDNRLDTPPVDQFFPFDTPKVDMASVLPILSTKLREYNKNLQ